MSNSRSGQNVQADLDKMSNSYKEKETNKRDYKKINNVKGQQVVDNKIIEDKQIVSRLKRLAKANIIQPDDVERLLPEVRYHIDHPKKGMTQAYALNAAIKAIRDGIWSTPKAMSWKENKAREDAYAAFKLKERQDCVESKLFQDLAKQMKGVDLASH